jgi:hypothetical protein
MFEFISVFPYLYQIIQDMFWLAGLKLQASSGQFNITYKKQVQLQEHVQSRPGKSLIAQSMASS